MSENKSEFGSKAEKSFFLSGRLKYDFEYKVKKMNEITTVVKDVEL